MPTLQTVIKHKDIKYNEKKNIMSPTLQTVIEQKDIRYIAIWDTTTSIQGRRLHLLLEHS